MKFNIGDKVIILNHKGTFEFLEYLSNPFWNKEKVFKTNHVKTIKAANDRLCSFYEDKIPDGFIAGVNEHAYYRQDGRCLCWCSSSPRVLHFEKDAEEIKRIINEGIARERFEAEERVKKEIESLEWKIKNLKENGDSYLRAFKDSEKHVVEYFGKLGCTIR